MSTFWRNARIATLAGERSVGPHRARRAAGRGDRIAWVGPRPPAGDVAAPTPSTTSAARWSRPAWSTATPTWSTAASARASSSSGCRARATKTSRAPAAASAPPWRRRARPATTTLFGSPRRALRADGRGRDDARDQVGLRPDAARRGALPARGAPPRRELPASPCAPPASPRTRCRPNTRAAPTTTSTPSCAWLPALHAEGLVDAVDAFCDRIAFTPAQTRRVFEAARAPGAAGQAACRAAERPGRRGARGRIRRAVVRPPRAPERSRRRAMARAGTVAVLLPGAYYFLRETRLPPIDALRAAGVPIAVATDRNPGTSPTLSLLLMLNMACTLFRLTPEEALRGVTSNAARALGLADRGTLAAGSAPTSRSGISSIRTSSPTGSAATRAGASSPAARSASMSDRLHAPPRHARRCWSACRTPARASRRSQRALCRSARWPSRTPTGTSTALYGFARELGATLLVPRIRATWSTSTGRRRTAVYPGANNTELCPTRFFTGEPMYRDGRARRRRGGARVRRTGAPTTTRWRRARALRTRHGPRVLFDGHDPVRAAAVVRGRLPDLNLGTAGGASCAPALRARWRGAGGAERLHESSTAASRAATSRATTGGPGRARAAAGDVLACYMDEAPPFASTRPRGARQPLLKRCMRLLDWKPDA